MQKIYQLSASEGLTTRFYDSYNSLRDESVLQKNNVHLLHKAKIK